MAVLSAQLLSDGKEIDIKGLIQITVPLAFHTRLRAFDSLPAWTFNMTTGRTFPHWPGFLVLEVSKDFKRSPKFTRKYVCSLSRCVGQQGYRLC